MTDHYRTYIFYGFAATRANLGAHKSRFVSSVSTSKCVFIYAPQSLVLLPSTHQLITEDEILQQHINLTDLVKHGYITDTHFEDVSESEISNLIREGQCLEKRPERWIAEFTMTVSGHLTLNRLLPII